jgi:RNA polymerase sigma factor (sigma-70 family)
LIAAVARRYRGSAAVDRDALQEGVVGALRALHRFDPARGIPFWAYASWWVRHAMQQLVSGLPYPVVRSDRVPETLETAEGAEEDAYERVEGRLAAEQPRALPGGLVRRERTVLRAHYGIGVRRRTLDDIADQFGVSGKRVRQIEARALDTLRAVALPQIPDP